MVRVALLALVTSAVISSVAVAQDDGPVVVSERVQEMASEFPLAKRLGFEWSSASVNDIGRYMGLLAAVNEVARSIAIENGREVPSEEEYRAAFAAFCILPNKPPVVETYWPKAYAAFSDQDVRNTLRSSIGPLTFTLPASISKGMEASTISTWPETESEYLDKVINLERLNDVE